MWCWNGADNAEDGVGGTSRALSVKPLKDYAPCLKKSLNMQQLHLAVECELFIRINLS